jgi:hypothetical protein
MNTPSHELAKIITDILSQEKIVLPEEADRMLPKLAEGKMTSEDWRFAIENAILKGESHE